ncbi:hypothetical protein [Mesorhizobium sp. ANAO-SY3R2]|uniref:hypothetical protein n=1 Tax=Mesorhizobium sp. ANAO-SY3R2 TaxID=3166644 RepID=UPI0036707127
MTTPHCPLGSFDTTTIADHQAFCQPACLEICRLGDQASEMLACPGLKTIVFARAYQSDEMVLRCQLWLPSMCSLTPRVDRMFASLVMEFRDVPAPLSGVRILLLEDEALIALDVEQLCRDNGAEDVVVASSLSEVGSIPAAYDAAILDVMVGGEPTLDFARALATRQIPFVFASGYDDVSAMSAAFPEVAIVRKPYAGPDLVDAVAASLGKGALSGDV